jgi:MFS family permease
VAIRLECVPREGGEDVGHHLSPSKAYKNYLLTLLMVILAFNFADRMALGIVLQDIKTDLDLSDTQLGFLTGIAFALFYAVMGVPIARWADRGNRIAIISITASLWSVAVALCGAATSFFQLLLIRVGVAVGESGGVPPALSLISDYFSRSERARAVARYMLGMQLALLVGYFAAGWWNELHGWRSTFVILGVPGLLLAALAHFTLREPRRQKVVRGMTAPPVAPVQASSPEPTFKEVCRTLWTIVAFRHLLFCFSVWYFFGYGVLQWTPAFFIRSHGLATGELGAWLAAIYGIAGALGVYLGGELASRFAAGNERRQLIACAMAFVFFPALNAYAFLAPTAHLAFAALAFACLGNMAQGPILATMQTLVPPRMRAMSIAIVYLFANLVGMGLGPLAAGAMSDALRPWFGEESLRYALAMLCPGYLWAAWHLWRASRTVTHEIAETQTGTGLDEATPRQWAVAK